MGVLHELYSFELPILANFQSLPVFSGSPLQYFWLLCTWLGDPKLSFTIYFPLVYGLNRRIGSLLLIAAATAEFVNGTSKWVLMGERPYWYIYEHKLNSSLLELRQFSPTCETGPGSPSGHAMVSAATWFTILFPTGLITDARRLAFYVSVLALISISRIYIVAHFIHQVFFGIACGLLIGVCVVMRLGVRSGGGDVSSVVYRRLCLSLTVSGFIVYQGLRLAGLDPDWSIPLALKWCANSRWVHIDTTPLASLTRNIACLFGAALATALPTTSHKSHKPDSVLSNGACPVAPCDDHPRRRHGWSGGSHARRVAAAALNVLAVQLSASVWLTPSVESGGSAWLLYASVFVKHAADVFLVMHVLPRLFSRYADVATHGAKLD